MGEEPAVDLVMQAAGAVSGRIALPLRVLVRSVEAILVSAEAYDRMCQAANRSVGQRTRIERDPEVQRFIDERLAMDELPTIREAVARHFGANRTPSSSGLHRYAVTRRQAAEAVMRPAKGRRGSRGPR